ncbi:hypothetical protein [Azospirillum sp. B506]|uniref:hypothetical protein n=1 Tax=Azospirillum sp. B506 TaxID=137721 RepID=UPI00034B9ADF|nr:hypothetical protein [Azospirillum sp. B506]
MSSFDKAGFASIDEWETARQLFQQVTAGTATDDERAEFEANYRARWRRWQSIRTAELRQVESAMSSAGAPPNPEQDANRAMLDAMRRSRIPKFTKAPKDAPITGRQRTHIAGLALDDKFVTPFTGSNATAGQARGVARIADALDLEQTIAQTTRDAMLAALGRSGG